jgi:predicted amidohydrolase YtcJ
MLRLMKYWAILVICLCSSWVTAQVPADTVLRGGDIYTVDANRSWAKAMAITEGKIVYVGLESGIDAYIGKQTNVVELNGQMVLPGFQDSHIHPISSSLNSYMCSLFGLPDVTSYLDEIADCIARNPDAEWIHGAGWAHRSFDTENQPTKFMLDKLLANRPLTLRSYDGHSLWANSKALSVAGIDSLTADVPSGKIIRIDNSLEPSGLFLEDPAQDLVMSAKGQYTDDETYSALLHVQKYLNSLGITSMQDALVDIGSDSNGIYSVLPAYLQAAEKGTLSLRVVAALYWDPNKGMEQIESMKAVREAAKYDRFRATSVKVWQDGVMHTHTSHLLEDYADKPGEKGMVMIPEDRLIQLVKALDKEGFQMHFHADGDGALRQCLDAVEAAIKENGRRDSRHHIAHLELVHPDDIPRFRELDVIANVQPIWSTSKAYISDLIEVKIGKKRKRWLQINKSFLDQGVTVAYGSDWYVTTPNPLEVIEAAVTRIRPALPLAVKMQSTPLLPDENVTVADAIASYTINGAYVNHQEQTTGSLEVGKLADFVILDTNIFAVPAVEISQIKVLKTYLDGDLVYERSP